MLLTEVFVLFFSRPSGDGQLMVFSLLEIILKEPEDYGIYSCTMKNSSLDFVIQNSGKISLDVLKSLKTQSEDFLNLFFF